MTQRHRKVFFFSFPKHCHQSNYRNPGLSPQLAELIEAFKLAGGCMASIPPTQRDGTHAGGLAHQHEDSAELTDRNLCCLPGPRDLD